MAIGYAAERLKNDERTRHARRGRRAVSDMNQKQLTGQPRAMSDDGQPASTARTIRNDMRFIRATRATGLAKWIASVLAGVTLCYGAACAASPAEDSAATAPAASTAFTTTSSACTHVAGASAYPVAAKPEAPPPLKGRVTDTTGVLGAACASELTARLADLESRLGVQMAILLVGSTGHSTIEQFATDVFDAWQLGRKKVDNGLLLVAALNDRSVRIEVGYGLEGAIPDIVAGRIIRERIVPAFRAQRIEAGVSDAVDALARELTPPQTAAADSTMPEAQPRGRDDIAEQETAQSAPQAVDALRRDNGLPERKSPDTGSVRFWFLLGLANVALGVVGAWRGLRRRMVLPAGYLVAVIVPGVMLPIGEIFNGNLEAILGAALFVPTAAGAATSLLGMELVRSARVRKCTAIVVGVLFMVIAIGRQMDYSIKEILSGIFSVLFVFAAIWAKLTGGGSSSSSSRSRSSSSSDSNFRGGGGSSGGGGASGRW
ncbi:TPM domain-containing protein [Burkholderia pseudomultivorans]|uniref:TPM domain-containing protein n=1 Tax=Burkholderia pseudomultivorans TaxID=1207504 RepID=UPI001E2DD9C7|nr:TPM domain-containing protein [Burkholderia pseudomultivorans]